MPRRLQVVQEGQDVANLNVVQAQLRYGSAEPFCEEKEEQTDRVSVRTDGMRAGPADPEAVIRFGA